MAFLGTANFFYSWAVLELDFQYIFMAKVLVVTFFPWSASRLVFGLHLKYQPYLLPRLTVVSREANKEQSES